MTHKYEVGDRVELVTDSRYFVNAFYPGALGNVTRVIEDGADVKVDGYHKPLYFQYDEILPFRQSEWRLVENYSDIDRDGIDVVFNDGEPVAYRFKPDVVKDVERRVRWDGHSLASRVCSDNATLIGQTRNGKPIGVWTIDMDDV